MDQVLSRSACKSMAPLEESSVVIAGLVRNGGHQLARRIDKLRVAFGAARTLGFIVVESDSRDATPDMLAALARGIPNFQAIFLGALQERFPHRTERIAHCRNAYLDAIGRLRGAHSPGYVVVADLDGVNDALDRGSVSTCFSSGEVWDVCAANQHDYYYDVWALRHPTWSPNDCWTHYDTLLPIIGSRQALELAVHARMVHLDPGTSMIPVASAFGGLAIYRTEALEGARYNARNATGERVCEHVPFHETVCANGNRIFVNPGLLNARSTNHSWHRKRTARAVRWLFPTLYQPDPQGTRQRTRLFKMLKTAKTMTFR